MMTFLDSLTVHRPGEAAKKIELYRGDLAALERKEAVDVLIVSAIRGNYVPTSVSLIGALQRRRKISVAELARNKAVDLRAYFSCWLSQDLADTHPDCGFKRILCFEPESNAHDVVEHLFQSLAPFLGGKLPLSTVAMPFVATGVLGSTVQKILPPLVDRAVEWMKLGFPLRCLKIVEYDKSNKPGQAAPVFADIKSKHHRWDVFISYSRQDQKEADILDEGLRERQFEVFRDTKSLPVGSEWWNEISNSVRSSGYFVPLYSADYVRSENCMSEFSIALASNKPVLFPICLCDVEKLPRFMTHNHMEVCPKGDDAGIRKACQILMRQMQQ
jgi:hypothetical protein